MTQCECKQPGFCERHQVNKTPEWHQLCQTHAGYFALWEEGRGPDQLRQSDGQTRAPAPSKGGPGTELKKLLSKFRLKPKGCVCNRHAAEMDRRGPVWCRENIDKIVGWLMAEAKKRKVALANLSRPAIKLLIRWAIRRHERRHET